MRDDRQDEVRFVLDQKIETPVAVYSGLPEILGLIILLRVKRWMVQILYQELHLLVESFADACWSGNIVFDRDRRKTTVHAVLRRLDLDPAFFT